MKTQLLLASLAAGAVRMPTAILGAVGAIPAGAGGAEPEADASPPVARARAEARTDRACPGAGATDAGTFREKGRT